MKSHIWKLFNLEFVLTHKVPRYYEAAEAAECEVTMSMISQMASSGVANTYEAQKTQKTEKKTSVYGKTIGKPELSETAQKYYEELKKKFSNMDFILVSTEMKEQAKAQAGNYASPNKTVVLIDEAKIEKMATDEAYRQKYESIIANAATQMTQMQSSLESSGTKVNAFGMQVNDDGSVDYFAVIDKSMAAQRERIKENAEKKAEAKKAAKKEAAEDAKEAAAEKAAQEKRTEKNNYKINSEDAVMVKASSIEELIQKINDVVYNSLSDYVQTEAELQVGQNFDFSI